MSNKEGIATVLEEMSVKIKNLYEKHVPYIGEVISSMADHCFPVRLSRCL